jgi:hypothetical protein
LAEIRNHRIDIVVVYKVDRLTRSLADFAKLVELFDQHSVSFVSVTQQFNTTTSMGRLTLNVLLSFAQFEREVTSERIRDKIGASKRKGLWVGGMVPLGYVSCRTGSASPACSTRRSTGRASIRCWGSRTDFRTAGGQPQGTALRAQQLPPSSLTPIEHVGVHSLRMRCLAHRHHGQGASHSTCSRLC